MLLLAINLVLSVWQMKSENFNTVDNLTSIQLLMVKACLSKTTDERECILRSWEKQVVMDDKPGLC